MGGFVEVAYGTKSLHDHEEPKRRQEEEYLSVKFIDGWLYGWKARPSPVLIRRGQWRQVYESLLDTPIDMAGCPYKAELAVSTRLAKARTAVIPRVKLTPDIVNRAFGEGAWDALSEAIIYI